MLFNGAASASSSMYSEELWTESPSVSTRVLSTETDELWLGRRGPSMMKANEKIRRSAVSRKFDDSNDIV